jgi:hypothetical protein
MKHNVLTRGLFLALGGVVGLTGCNTTFFQRPSAVTLSRPVAMPMTTPTTVVVRPPVFPTNQGVVQASYTQPQALPPVAGSPSLLAASQAPPAPAPRVANLATPESAADATPPNVYRESLRPEPTVPTEPAPVVIAANNAPTPVSQVPYRSGKAGYPRGESVVARRSYVDITAASCCGHAEDYSWLRGEIEYSRACNGWRLRYASVDESDSYGGSVVLTGNVKDLKEGMKVLVKGSIHNGRDKNAPAAYRVEALDVLQN